MWAVVTHSQNNGAETGLWLGREDSNLGIAGVAHMLTATTTADSQAHCRLDAGDFENRFPATESCG